MIKQFVIPNLRTLLIESFVHLRYVVVAVLMASLIAIVLASFLSRFRHFSSYILPILSIFQTIPGIVFIGVLFVYTGMRPLTVYIALTIYAVFPILKNTYVGLIEIDESILEAARGIGMNKWESLILVEIPMASPSIFTGIRMATVYTVSWAVLAAMIGQGGLGEFIYIGLDTNVPIYVLMGALSSAFLAVISGKFVDFLQKQLVPSPLIQKERD